MAPLRLEIVTAERSVFADDVDVVVVPGIDGQLSILPHHAPLLTALQVGELRIKKQGEEISMALSGGFLEVMRNKVLILADTAERDDEIDLERAEAAKRRAEQTLQTGGTGVDRARAEAALRRALIRINVAQRRRRRGPGTLRE
ncbi:MAG: ATP synthase F1 subunit epsilon [Chloroflexi bacterium RBG_13_54_9]|nr:MAG: ATP synthase F1 subunit epsilon [Chloroflexi bacterium RBG_13_54_9]